HHEENQRERGQSFSTVPYRHEFWAIELRRDGKEFSREADDAIFFEVHFAFEIHHFNPAEDQKSAKDIKEPMEHVDERHARADHDAPHNQRPENSPEKHAVLLVGWDLEIGEDKRNDEHVVHGQGQLNKVAGDKF